MYPYAVLPTQQHILFLLVGQIQTCKVVGNGADFLLFTFSILVGSSSLDRAPGVDANGEVGSQ